MFREGEIVAIDWDYYGIYSIPRKMEHRLAHIITLEHDDEVVELMYPHENSHGWHDSTGYYEERGRYSKKFMFIDPKYYKKLIYYGLHRKNR